MIELLAESNNFGDTREGGLAGPTGLVIVLLLVAGTIFLIRNMNARLRRLPERFESQGSPEPPRAVPPSGGAPRSGAPSSGAPSSGAEDAR